MLGCERFFLPILSNKDSYAKSRGLPQFGIVTSGNALAELMAGGR